MTDDFHPPFWLRNAHLQTMWGRLARGRRVVATRREIVEAPDGDEIVLDHLDGAPERHFIMLHGLEGSSNSVYMQGMLQLIARRGYAATVLNFRACAREIHSVSASRPNRGMRLYHSGETSDLDHVVSLLQSRHPASHFVAAGVSLGGNVLLKWLGENPDQRVVRRAATMSVPYDLAAGARYLEKGLGRLYVKLFVRTLTEKAESTCRRHPHLSSMIDLERARRAWTFWEFDDAVTAPLHGFAGADDYYRRSSSLFFLHAINVPTLCISAKDDPFVPPETLSRVALAKSDKVELVVAERGGHAGFVDARGRYWAEERIVEFLSG